MNDLFPDPAPDFSDPIGLLKACHQRILRYCDLLEKMIALTKQTERSEDTDKEIRDAANQIKRYFSTAGALHHLDEEQSLFPVLIRTSMKMADLIHALKQAHKQSDALWKQLSPLLSDPTKPETLDSLEQVSEEFCAFQREHVKQEESGVLAMAEHILSSDQLRNIGYSMEEQRKSNR